MIHRWVKLVVKIAAVLLITFAVIEASLPILGSFWHLTHKKPFTIAGRTFDVPAKYFLVSNNGALSMTLFSPVVPFLHRESGITGKFAKINMISFRELKGKSFDKSGDYERLKKWLVMLERKEDLELVSTKTLTTNAGEVSCFQFSNEQETQVRCLFDGSVLTVYFTGEAKFAQDVYSTLESGRIYRPVASN